MVLHSVDTGSSDRFPEGLLPTNHEKPVEPDATP